ncbi:UTRA domain-containing protein, partial [Ktedonospora formicarum]|uniref:UTRA domain-containing protein n=1 Tax=Ktedonospora formicarum TaxID=2778364 RepID=UPI001C68AF40
SGTHLLIPKQLEETYHINNTTTQMLLMRLANEGLVKILPVRERSWPNNASLNEYHVAELVQAQPALLRRHNARNPDLSPLEKEVLLLKIQYADQEIAHLLSLKEGEKVVLYRERNRRTDTTVMAISDMYLPFWFVEVLPEVERPESNVYQLLQHLGKIPHSCMETVSLAHAHSLERTLFELSPDDPAPLLKVKRRVFDEQKQPLVVQFLTLRGESASLEYSFPFTA